MSTRNFSAFVPRCLAPILGVAALLFTTLAVAAGRVEWKSRTVKERDDKAWRLDVALYMPRAPDVPHVPMKFEFQPEVYFERDMIDGDKIVERKVPLDGRQPLIESVDVGFLDSGSGKIEPRTRFTFKVTRAHGYDAGEYKVTIRDSRNGQMVGTPVTLTFDGENEIIDRRAMVFGGEKKKKDSDIKKVGDDKSDDKKADDKKSDDKKADDTASAKAAADKPATDEEAPKSDAKDEPKEKTDEAGTIKEKPGGCGCRIEDASSPGRGAEYLGGLLLVGLLLRRRRALRAA